MDIKTLTEEVEILHSQIEKLGNDLKENKYSKEELDELIYDYNIKIFKFDLEQIKLFQRLGLGHFSEESIPIKKLIMSCIGKLNSIKAK